MTLLRTFAQRRLVAPVLAMLMTASVVGAQTKVKPGFNLFSVSQDAEIGRASATEVERQLPLVTDREVVAYVNEIGKRLAAHSGGPGFSYQFRVVNASDINAFALPGGYVYVNRGILTEARNDGEVAGVIAHEIAHVALRHGTHQASKAYGAQAGLSILGGLLSGRVGESTAAIMNALGGFGMNALFLKFSRELETQADVRGAQILAAAGYTPADMTSFFHTLAKVDQSRKTTWLSHHPAPPDRIARIEREAKLLKVSSQPTRRVAELAQVQRRLRQLGAAPTTAQLAQGQRGSGTPTAVEPPSRSLRSYTSPAKIYRVSYPGNWRVYEQGATGVVFAPAGGIAEVGDRTEIVYGAILNHYEPFGSAAAFLGDVTLESATNDLLAQLQKGDSHLRVVRGSARQLNVDGGRALAVNLRGVNPNTRIDERVTVVTQQLTDEHLVYLLFATPERDASKYSSTLSAMVASLRISEGARH
ncbi:MAG: M48 family metallopeptidase [Thermoanaerobaculia bacterium]|nr:M48 family metallopeptidase [Thermoanaerobaculia bacterium]